MNKNWDEQEQELNSESQLQSIHKEHLHGISDEPLDEKLTEIINSVQYLLDQRKLHAESDAHNLDMAIPDNVISFRTNGFDINMDNMPVEEKYRFRFEGSRYVIWKNTRDELVVEEVD